MEVKSKPCLTLDVFLLPLIIQSMLASKAYHVLVAWARRDTRGPAAAMATACWGRRPGHPLQPTVALNHRPLSTASALPAGSGGAAGAGAGAFSSPSAQGERKTAASYAAQLKGSASLSTELEAILGELKEQGRYHDMLALYHGMEPQQATTLSFLSGSYLLEACAERSNVQTAWKLMEPRLLDPSWHGNVEGLLSVLRTSKDFPAMLQVLDEARDRGCSWVESAFRVILSRMVKRQSEEALKLFKRSWHYGVQRDAHMYALAIYVCAAVGDGGQAVFFLNQADRAGVRLDLSVLCYAGAACRPRRFEAALQEVMRRIKRLNQEQGWGEASNITQDALDAAGIRSWQADCYLSPMLIYLDAEQAMDLIYEMAARGHAVGARIYNAVGMPRRALELFSQIPGPQRTMDDYSEAFRSFAALLEQQQQQQQQPGVQGGAAAAAGGGLTVHGVLQEMMESGLPVRKLAVRLAFRALQLQVPPATHDLRALLAYLRAHDEQPCGRGGLIAIQALTSAGLRSEAWSLLEDVYARWGLHTTLLDFRNGTRACATLGAWPVACWLYDQVQWHGAATSLHLQFLCHALRDHHLMELVGRPLFQQAVRDGTMRTVSQRERQIDLHRLSPPLAQLVISEGLEELRQEWLSQQQRRVGNVYVAPGRGNGKLRAAVLEYLFRSGLITRTDFKRYHDSEIESHRLGSIPIYGDKLRSVWKRVRGPLPLLPWRQDTAAEEYRT